MPGAPRHALRWYGIEAGVDIAKDSGSGITLANPVASGIPVVAISSGAGAGAIGLSIAVGIAIGVNGHSEKGQTQKNQS